MYFKRIDVLYFIEHKDREIEVAKKIAKKLNAEYGLNIAIVSQLFDAVTALFKFTPKVVITPTPSFSKGSAAWMFHKIYSNNIKFVSLNFEQFLGSWESGSKMVFSDFTKTHQKH